MGTPAHMAPEVMMEADEGCATTVPIHHPYTSCFNITLSTMRLSDRGGAGV